MSDEPQILQLAEQPTAVVRGRVRMDELTDFYDRAYRTVLPAVQEQGLLPREAIGLYLSPPTETLEIEAGFVVDGEVAADGDVVPSVLPGGEVARMTHMGPYDQLGEAWGALMRWVGEQGRAPGGPMWEAYVTEPSPDADPATMRTDLFCLLA